MPSPESMKAAVTRCLLEGFNTGDLAVMDEIFHPDYVRHASAGEVSVCGLEAHKADLRAMRAALAEAHYELHELVAEGEVVAARFTLHGRHVGTYRGVAPSGRRVRLRFMAFFHFRDTKIAAGYVLGDAQVALRGRVGGEEPGTTTAPPGIVRPYDDP